MHRSDDNIRSDDDFFLFFLPFYFFLFCKRKDEFLIRGAVDLIQVCEFVTVVMHKDKEENSHHDSHYRARELAALAAYDHHHLDGEMFLQVSKSLLLNTTLKERKKRGNRERLFFFFYFDYTLLISANITDELKIESINYHEIKKVLEVFFSS